MSRENSRRHIQPAGQDTHPGRLKMKRPAPARRPSYHERHRQIEQRRSTRAPSFAPIKTWMRQEYSDATRHQTKETNGVSPVSEAYYQAVSKRARKTPFRACGRAQMSRVIHRDVEGLLVDIITGIHGRPLACRRFSGGMELILSPFCLSQLSDFVKLQCCCYACQLPTAEPSRVDRSAEGCISYESVN